jgi:uncharacterized Zn-binding protein involved in type VI secretion
MADGKPKDGASVRLTEIANIEFPAAATVGWDSYWRGIYEKLLAALQSQANELVARGDITREEAEQLVNDRNGILLAIREKLTPTGKFISETLKPRESLPTFEQLLAEKGSFTAVVASVGKSRVVVNQISVVGRRLGPAGVAFQIVTTATVIAQAPPELRGEVAAEETGAGLVSFLYGSIGMRIGAAAVAAVPGAGEVELVVLSVLAGLATAGIGRKPGKALGRGIWRYLIKVWPKGEQSSTGAGRPAARVTDLHLCPMVTGMIAHVGGPVATPGCPHVRIGRKPAARVGDTAICMGPTDTVATGAFGVLIGGSPPARIGDLTAHGGKIVQGFPAVLIKGGGGGSGDGGSALV